MGGGQARELIALRTILVSTRTALLKTESTAERERIKDRATELLAKLEAAVITDGANPDVLAGLEEARREVWE